MVANPKSPVAPRGWAIGGSILGGFCGFVIRTPYGVPGDIIFIVSLGFIGAVLANELEYQWMKQKYGRKSSSDSQTNGKDTSNGSVETDTRTSAEHQTVLLELKDRVDELQSQFEELQDQDDSSRPEKEKSRSTKHRRPASRNRNSRVEARSEGRQMLRCRICGTVFPESRSTRDGWRYECPNDECEATGLDEEIIPLED